jgi:hypothetical protein
MPTAPLVDFQSYFAEIEDPPRRFPATPNQLMRDPASPGGFFATPAFSLKFSIPA